LPLICHPATRRIHVGNATQATIEVQTARAISRSGADRVESIAKNTVPIAATPAALARLPPWREEIKPSRVDGRLTFSPQR